MIGGLAHELRNPLSTMMINLKLLAEDLDDEETNPRDMRRRARNKVDQLTGEAKRLQSLFDEFLSLTGPFKLHRADTKLDELAGNLIEFVRPMAESQNITVTLTTHTEDYGCRIDAALIRQALLNLLINAQQAMPEGGTLEMELQGDQEALHIDVRDSGIGISKSDQQRMFRPFFSTKSAGN
ncbi:MAG: sensor histidine kinase, partial [Phycisphaerae bacterium]